MTKSGNLTSLILVIHQRNMFLKGFKNKHYLQQVSGSETYTNGIILGLFSMFFVGASGYLVDFVGQKILMFILLILCAICSGSLYWTNSSIQAALLISATCGLMQSALSLQQNILIRVFPTTVR